MTSQTSPAPTRRSALEGIHRALAHGRSSGPAWPASYGDVEAERAAVATTIGLAEPGLYDKLVIRGRNALTSCRANGLDGRPGRVTPAPPGGINVWAIADDEVWLVAFAPIPGGPALPSVDFAPIEARLTADRAYVTDVSSGWTVMRLVGPLVRDLLEELVAQDLASSVVPDQAILQVTMAGSRVIMSRRDYDQIPGFTLLVARDEAEHLWEVFTHLGEPYGLRPVGASALLPAPGAGVAAAAPAGASR